MIVMPAPQQITELRSSIDPVFLDSPLMRHPALDEALGCDCMLKVETLNPIRSFKGRGTEAVLSTHDPAAGVITTSTGNFGQGIARAAARRGVDATIVCPADANPVKVEAMRRLGATVQIAAPDDGDGKALARRIAADRGLTFIEDGAHPEIAVGAGGIAQELTDSGAEPDVLLIQIGDGALALGVGSWMKARSPETRIVGVIASGAPSMARSLDAGRPVEVAPRTVADGMAIDRPVDGMVDLLPRVVDEVVLVDDDTILAAVRLLAQAAGLLAEPSGAAGIAAMMAQPARFRGLHVATVVTGSNIHPQLLAELGASVDRVAAAARDTVTSE